MRSPRFITLLAASTLLACSCKPRGSSPPPSAPQGNVVGQQPIASAQSPSPLPDQSLVTLDFFELNLEDLVPFLSNQTGKTVTLSSQFSSPALQPTYRFTLQSSAPIPVSEALAQIMAKLRTDGLDIQETEGTMVISPGNYTKVWRPSWWPKDPPS